MCTSGTQEMNDTIFYAEGSLQWRVLKPSASRLVMPFPSTFYGQPTSRDRRPEARFQPLNPIVSMTSLGRICIAYGELRVQHSTAYVDQGKHSVLCVHLDKFKMTSSETQTPCLGEDFDQQTLDLIIELQLSDI